jgi:hypothetical protein
MFAIVIVLLIVVGGYIALNKDKTPTTDAVIGPDRSHVPPPIKMSESVVLLYTELDFGGTEKKVKPGQSIEFARTTNNKLTFKYPSMKITKGTYIMLVSGNGGSTDRGFAVGDENVPDMYDFIKSYDNLYTQEGIYMDRDYRSQPFFIRHLTQTEWDYERTKKHESCLRTANVWNNGDKDNENPHLRYNTEEKRLDYCRFAHPDTNNANVTGFCNQITTMNR